MLFKIRFKKINKQKKCPKSKSKNKSKDFEKELMKLKEKSCKKVCKSQTHTKNMDFKKKKSSFLSSLLKMNSTKTSWHS